MEDFNSDEIQAIPRPKTNAYQEHLNDVASNAGNTDFILRCGEKGRFIIIFSLKSNGQAGFINTLEKNILEYLGYAKEEKKHLHNDLSQDYWNFYNITSICPTYRRAKLDEQTPIFTLSNKGQKFPFKNIVVFIPDATHVDTISYCKELHDTCKRMISKGAQFAHKYKLKIYDISADDEVASLDHLLQDNCIFQLIEKHYKVHLSPNYGAFYKNIYR